jgi:outer membrane lipoprotein SlyB
MRNRILTILLLPLLSSACVMTSTTTRTWSDPGAPTRRWERYGRVDSVRETVHRQHGNPAGGAVAGAVVGGLLGSVIGGHGHHGHWHGSAAGAAVGAVGGAMVGAAASQGSAEDRWYEVSVRFEDGGYETFVYRGALPFRPGDEVVLTSRGLELADI